MESEDCNQSNSLEKSPALLAVKCGAAELSWGSQEILFLGNAHSKTSLTSSPVSKLGITSWSPPGLFQLCFWAPVAPLQDSTAISLTPPKSCSWFLHCCLRWHRRGSLWGEGISSPGKPAGGGCYPLLSLSRGYLKSLAAGSWWIIQQNPSSIKERLWRVLWVQLEVPGFWETTLLKIDSVLSKIKTCV